MVFAYALSHSFSVCFTQFTQLCYTLCNVVTNCVLLIVNHTLQLVIAAARDSFDFALAIRLRYAIDRLAMLTTSKINWTQPTASGHRSGWARTCVALTQVRGARGLVGDYLVPGEQLLELDTLVVEVRPTGAVTSGVEVARILRVTQAGLRPATYRVYQWRTELVSLREKLQELLEAVPDDHPERYPAECDQTIADGLPTHILIETLRRRGITHLT